MGVAVWQAGVLLLLIALIIQYPTCYSTTCVDTSILGCDVVTWEDEGELTLLTWVNQSECDRQRDILMMKIQELNGLRSGCTNVPNRSSENFMYIHGVDPDSSWIDALNSALNLSTSEGFEFSYVSRNNDDVGTTSNCSVMCSYLRQVEDWILATDSPTSSPTLSPSTSIPTTVPSRNPSTMSPTLEPTIPFPTMNPSTTVPSAMPTRSPFTSPPSTFAPTGSPMISPPDNSGEEESGSFPVAMVAGAAVGVILFVLIVVLWLRRSKRKPHTNSEALSDGWVQVPRDPDTPTRSNMTFINPAHQAYSEPQDAYAEPEDAVEPDQKPAYGLLQGGYDKVQKAHTYNKLDANRNNYDMPLEDTANDSQTTPVNIKPKYVTPAGYEQPTIPSVGNTPPEYAQARSADSVQPAQWVGTHNVSDSQYVPTKPRYDEPISGYAQPVITSNSGDEQPVVAVRTKEHEYHQPLADTNV